MQLDGRIEYKEATIMYKTINYASFPQYMKIKFQFVHQRYGRNLMSANNSDLVVSGSKKEFLENRWITQVRN